MVDILKNTVLITALLLATSTSVMATDNIASATVANIESTEVIAQKAKDEVKVEKTETIDANATKENKDKATVETTENGVKLENDIEGKNANLPSKKQESSKKEIMMNSDKDSLNSKELSNPVDDESSNFSATATETQALPTSAETNQSFDNDLTNTEINNSVSSKAAVTDSTSVEKNILETTEIENKKNEVTSELSIEQSPEKIDKQVPQNKDEQTTTIVSESNSISSSVENKQEATIEQQQQAQNNNQISTIIEKLEINESKAKDLNKNISFLWMIILGGMFISIIAFGYAFYKVKKVHEKLQNQLEDRESYIETLNNFIVMALGQQKAQEKLLNLAEDANGNKTINKEPNHELVLKIADEICRMEGNLVRMDPSIKGYKQLKKGIERVKNNFIANGYEIVDMLDKKYQEGMKAVVSFTQDDNLAKDEMIITSIIKPQVNYQGQMIQSAQITVSQNNE